MTDEPPPLSGASPDPFSDEWQMAEVLADTFPDVDDETFASVRRLASQELQLGRGFDVVVQRLRRLAWLMKCKTVLGNH